jgi:glutamyl-tRNA reductase
MDYKIYLIEDCDGLKYVGSTNQTLNARLSKHRSDKKRNRDCSSYKLNLEDCSITELEKCDEENKLEREQYWKDHTDCVNERNMVFDEKQYKKEYYQKNKEKIKEYREKNKEQIKQKKKQYNEKNKDKIKEQKRDRYIRNVVKDCLNDLITELENKNK